MPTGTQHKLNKSPPKWHSDTMVSKHISFPTGTILLFHTGKQRGEKQFETHGKTANLQGDESGWGAPTWGEAGLLRARTSEGKGSLTEKRLKDYPRASHPRQHKSGTRQCPLHDSNRHQIIMPPMK